LKESPKVGREVEEMEKPLPKMKKEQSFDPDKYTPK